MNEGVEGKGVHYQQRDKKGHFKKLNPVHKKHKTEIEAYMKGANPLPPNLAVRMVARDVRFLSEREKLIREKQERRELERVSIIDPLTNMYRRGFLDGNPDAVPPKKGILEREIERMLYDKKDLAVAMLDIDHFKPINDKYGHQTGDEVLRRVAQTVLKNIRSELGDFAIRYGGEEFLVITPNGLEVAQRIVERIRKEVEKIQFYNNNYPTSITISCGLTNLSEDRDNKDAKEIAEAMIRRADAALYKSKHDGRNQTTVAVQNKDRTIEFKKISLGK